MLDAARDLFFKNGYAATGTPEVVDQAGVTRGALYHHFKDKKALFQAVVEAEAAQIAEEIDAGAQNSASPMEALLNGARAYFNAMRKPGRVRLMLIEGLSILGPDEMRRIDFETGGRELRSGIMDALGDNVPSAEIEICADLISAMFDRAALACAEQKDSSPYEQVIANLLKLLVQDQAKKPA